MVCTLLLPLALLAGGPAEDDPFVKAAALLSQHCVRCHNADTARGGLDLSTHDSAMLGGATSDAIVAGDSSRSAIVSRAAEGSMPPEKDGRRLTPGEVDILRKWINGGANWPESVTLPVKPIGPPQPAAQASPRAIPATPRYPRWRFRL
jgi:mono/diheme cytochrome c family protein